MNYQNGNTNQTPNLSPQELYKAALAAAGTCEPGHEAQWFGRVRTLAVAMLNEGSKTLDFIAMADRALNYGGESNGNKGWGVINGTITNVELNYNAAGRARIHYTATRDGNAETILTKATNYDAEAREFAHYVATLVGHKVRLLKFPEPTGKRENGFEKSQKVCFSIIDEGLANVNAGEHVYGKRGNETARNQQSNKRQTAPAQNNVPAEQYNAGGNPMAAQNAPQSNQSAPAQAPQSGDAWGARGAAPAGGFAGQGDQNGNQPQPQQSAPAPNPAPAQVEQNAPAPQHAVPTGKPANQQLGVFFQSVAHNVMAGQNQDRIKQVCAQAWATIGNPRGETIVTDDQFNQAYVAAQNIANQG